MGGGVDILPFPVLVLIAAALGAVLSAVIGLATRSPRIVPILPKTPGSSRWRVTSIGPFGWKSRCVPSIWTMCGSRPKTVPTTWYEVSPAWREARTSICPWR